MKTNLHKMYQTDSSLELSGIWMDLGPELSFKVRRFGGGNGKALEKAMAKYHAPFAKKISTGNLSNEEINEIDAKVLCEACIVDWKGVVDENGNPLEFNLENAVETLKDLPELMQTIIRNATNFENYKADLGNF